MARITRGIQGEPTVSPETWTERFDRFVAGDLVKVRGVRGTFRVHYFDVRPDRVVVTVWDTAPQRGRWRSFTADQIVRKVRGNR